MGNIKKWATGAIGNSYPDHSDRNNPNSAGLDSEGFPGVEAYIEEDEVTASTDNRPLKNLVENDGIISQNVTDVASEVDNGVFKDKYNAFDMEIQSQDSHKDPETNEDILINPIRIKSGSAIINGQVTRIGNQKLVYFYRDNDSNSILFPTEDSSGSYKIEIYDDDYFADKTTRTFGAYTPVYNTITDDLPSNFENYEVNIIQRDTKDLTKNTVTIFSLYRDWEDIVPFKAHSEAISNEVVKFNSDLNFGQKSEGYWLDCNNAKNTKVTDVEVKKDIIIKNKMIPASEFALDGSGYSKTIVTDGLFFKDITWSDNEYFDKKSDIQDLYRDDSGYLYFIQRSIKSKRLFRLPDSSSQLETKEIGTVGVNLKLKAIGNYLFITGTQGFVNTLDLSKIFSEAYALVELENFWTQTKSITSEDITDVTVWNNKIWIAGETKIWYTDYTDFNPKLATFTEVNVAPYILNSSGSSILSHINTLLPVVGNYRSESSLNSNIINLLKNPSFEYGGVGNSPNNWTFSENASGSTFKITADEHNIGEHSVFVRKNEYSTYCSASQIVSAKASAYTLSAYLKSNIATTDKVKLAISELDSTGTILSTSESEFVPTTSFVRYSYSHTITNSATTAIKAEIISELVANTVEGLYIDNVQLEVGTAENEYVESFDYLFVGFRKDVADIDNPPFAFIDADDPYNIKYIQGKYGNIKSVNDAIADGNNKIVFVDDKNINTLIILNNKDEYDGFTVSSLLDHSNDTYDAIKKFETIKKIGNKYYYGGIVDNRVVKIECADNKDHTIVIEDALNYGLSFLTLMGGYSFIEKSDNRNAAIQFNRMAPCYDSVDNVNALGRYIPRSAYAFKITLDGDVDDARIITVTAPENNKAPWSINEIRAQLYASIQSASIPLYSLMSGVSLAPTEDVVPDTAYSEWYSVSSSLTVKDGFYATNGTDIETYIRGNIHSVFVKNDDMYIAKDSQVFRSKVDSNLIKVKNTTSSKLMAARMSKNYYISKDWDLYNTDYSLKEYNAVVNKELVFMDDANNRSWIDLDVGSGYTILPGSLRVKTNATTEVGYSEGVDYFVDYDGLKIIRSKNKNLLKNSAFSSKIGNDLSGWTFYKDASDAISESSQELYNSDFTKYALKMICNASVVKKPVFYQNVASTDISGFQTLQKGETYTFSVYVQAAKAQGVKIRITECNETNKSSFSNTLFSETEQQLIGDGKWVRVLVSYTVTSSSSTNLRVEIYATSAYQTFVCKPMLEKNSDATPYIESQKNSKIAADSHVWVDYIRIKTLIPVTDYVFDTTNRKVKLTSAPDAKSTYYFDYKYSKIFNPYCYEDQGSFSKPTIDIIDYTENDDYFLFELEGKIWAINQNFALLSLDEENPIKVTYKYHYPRIDQIKIRNSPDKYGNYLYMVHGNYNKNNPYKPVDVGLTKDRYVYSTNLSDIKDLNDTKYFNNIDNEVLYEINVQNNDFTKNDFYDRRIYINAKSHKLYNISLYPETVAYFPFLKDFNATNGLSPLNTLTASKIIPIIKNYLIVQNSEVGAYHDNYQYVLRNNPNMITPQASYSIYVDPINGSDAADHDGSSIGGALKTVKKALTFLTKDRCNIIITSSCIISENIEIDKDFEVKIFATTYCHWKGGLQNDSELSIQGIWFQNTNVYSYDALNIFYCSFENTSINCVYPQAVSIYNCEFYNCHNPIVRVKDIIFPSPFTHPYQRFALRDDGVANTTDATTATSYRESIAPGDSFYNAKADEQPSGTFKFYSCLIYGSTDSIIKYDPNPNWDSSFSFEYCTIANNKKVIETEKYNLTINFTNDIIYQNYVTDSVDGNDKYLFVSSNSDITFNNCYIDFSKTEASSSFNDLAGVFSKRESCIGGAGDNPGFVGEVNGSYDYHLKSIAKGSSIDSPCLDKGEARDIGVYDESREQQDKGLPQRLRTYVADIREGVVYPVQLNSEKITVTIDFKPSGSVGAAAIILDTRTSAEDEDYFVLAYNNNNDDSTSLTQDSITSTNPFKFRVILANKEKSYAVVSPIEINTDEEFQIWHNISFTINYEEIINNKSGFVNKDKKQNIITLYHNDTVTIESFIKYDLNYYINGELIEGRGEDNNNLWNYNNICQVITIGSDYSNNHKMLGYYTEFRLDNRFIDRKQLDAWKEKEMPFADPMAYVNQTPLTRSLNPTNLNEYWSLKSKSLVGAKGNSLSDKTSKEVVYDNGDIVWAITESKDNLYSNGTFEGVKTASVIADKIISYPITISNPVQVKTTNSLYAADNTGYYLALAGTYTSKTAFVTALNAAFAQNPNTCISYTFTPTGLLKFYTKDWGSDTSVVNLSVIPNAADYTKLGFNTMPSPGIRTPKDYVVEGLTLTNSNRVWVEDDEKNLFEGNALYINKDSSVLSEDVIKIYQKPLLSTGSYTFTCYISSEDFVDSNSVGMYYNYNTVVFDKIERYYGNCWRCTKVLSAQSAKVPVGIIVQKKGSYNIVGMQLETGNISNPFSAINKQENGKLVVPKNVINKDSGVIAFRFKPLFEYTDTTSRYILEAVGVDGENLVEDKGYKIVYHYDTTKKRGIITYSINKTATDKTSVSIWSFEISERYFNQWHTCIINYDYNINRYVFWYDYYNNIIDDSLTNCDLSDLYIGHGVEDFSRSDIGATQTANILVKDVIITNYPITDTESQNWINAYEFFNEGLVVNTIEQYKNQVETYVSTSENFAEVANNLLTETSALSADVAKIDSEHASISADIDALQQTSSANTIGISSLSKNLSDLTTTLNNYATIIGEIKDDNTGKWESNKSNLFDIKTVLDATNISLSGEIAARTAGDVSIRNDLAATSAGSSGAMLVGINKGTMFSSSTVEAALKELAGPARTIETVYGLSQSINSLLNNFSSSGNTLNLMKDGGNGSTWTEAKAANDGYNIVSLKTNVSLLNSSVTALQNNAALLATNVTTEVARLDARLDKVYTDYASIETGKGASLIGFYNGTLFESSTVEAALKELAGPNRNAQMTVSGLYDRQVSVNSRVADMEQQQVTIEAAVANIPKIADGGDGSTWTTPATTNLVAHQTAINTINTSLTELSGTVDAHTTALDGAVNRISVVENGLATEITTRQNSINLFKSSDSGKGAALVGVNDAADNFAASNVEDVLAELANKIAALAGALSWQSAIATYADLPLTGNKVGDARTVKADADGHQSQYVCVATTGLASDQWVKIADIDWGNASAIAYDNKNSKLDATDVNAALDEIVERTSNPAKFEIEFKSADWVNGVATVTHELGSENVSVLAYDLDTGMVVGLDEIIRINKNQVELHVTNPVNVSITIFAVIDRMTAIIDEEDWLVNGAEFYYDIVHGFNKKAVMVSAFETVSGNRIGLGNIESIDENTTRIHVSSKAKLNVYLAKNVQNTQAKDVRTWKAENGMFSTTIPDMTGYDAVYAFFEIPSGKTVEIDTVNIVNGTLKLVKTTSDPIRMIIIQ